MSIKRLETLHTFHIRAMTIYRTESSHVHSCFRCTGLEKDETLLSTDFASESPKARWDDKSVLFSLCCVLIKAVHFTSLRSQPHYISIWPSERKAFFFSDDFYEVYQNVRWKGTLKPNVSRVLPLSGLKQLKNAGAVKCSFFPLFLPIARSQVSTLQSIKPWVREGINWNIVNSLLNSRIISRGFK